MSIRHNTAPARPFDAESQGADSIPLITSPLPKRRESLPTPTIQDRNWLIMASTSTMATVEASDDANNSYVFEAKSQCKDNFKTLYEFYSNQQYRLDSQWLWPSITCSKLLF